MSDQMEILLQEIAILRQEIARLHGLLEESSEALRSLNLAFLQRMDALTVSMREILAASQHFPSNGNAPRWAYIPASLTSARIRQQVNKKPIILIIRYF